MFDTKQQKRLERAVRSLLVAADQRCPAIIGQAHLLYHAGGGSSRSSAEQALIQLKGEAQDLLNAIANAEAEMKAAMSDP
jgi:predicted nuclease with RNAse H fold